MKFDKNLIKPVVVLTVICLAVAAILAAVNAVTADIIAANEKEAIRASLTDALPGGDFDVEAPLEFRTDCVPQGLHKKTAIQSIYADKNGNGYAVVLTTSSSYSNADMGVTLGVDFDGNVVKVVITSYSETKDFRKNDYVDSYVGKNPLTVGEVDLFTGATYSSTALKDAVTDALEVLRYNGFLRMN